MGLLKRAELSDGKVKIDSRTFRYADLDEYWQTARGTGQRRRLDVLKPEETERVRAALADRVKRHHRVDGIYVEATALLARAERLDPSADLGGERAGACCCHTSAISFV